MSEIKHPVFERLSRAVSEAAREALAAEFEGIGILFSDLHPTIRAVMERGAISTADAKQQVDSFVRVAALADQFNLTDEQRDYAPHQGLRAASRATCRRHPGDNWWPRADPPRPGA